VIEGSRRRAVSAAFFWGLFMVALTSWPKPPEIPIVSSVPNFDKLIHIILYGVEGFLLYRAVRWPGTARGSTLRVLWIVAVMAVWGVLDEVHQYWIPGRSMEGGDVVADVCGATVGAIAASFAARRGPSLRSG
jgi:VanZ family protein